MVISEDNYAMLLTERRFKEFTPKTIADPKKTTEVLAALSNDSRKAVGEICRKAFTAGGRDYRKPQDVGFMYGWGFEDLGGHIWEHFWMDPKGIPPAGRAKAAAPAARGHWPVVRASRPSRGSLGTTKVASMPRVTAAGRSPS